MDKKDRANKRRQDKHHKKPPPPKTTGKAQKDSRPDPVPTQSAPLVVYDDPFSKRPIDQNWSREPRDFPSDDSGSEDEQLQAADLEKLLQMPPSASGHFFLSTERHWTEEATEPSIVSGKTGQQYGRHFQIDTNKLNLCLSTIPLHKRNEYSEDFFNKREIGCMKLRASEEAKKYQDICSKIEPLPKMANRPNALPSKCLIGPDAQPPRKEAAPVQPPVPCLVGPMALPPELRSDPTVTERLAEVTLEDRTRATPSDEDVVPIDAEIVVEGTSKDEKDQSNEARKETTAKVETKEDIQQWLDDILDM